MKHIHIETIGMAMIGMARKAIDIIRHECHELVVENKLGGYQGKEDCVTNSDYKAQEMYHKEITGQFPQFGIIGEELGLRIPCMHPAVDAYFTVDPLDGTKAHCRKQSHGVSTMIAFICDGVVMAVVIGDVNSGDIYSYADEHLYGGVIRERFGHRSLMEPEIKLPLRKQYLCLRDAPRGMPKIVNDMARYPDQGGLFKNIEVSGGSIGCNFARLWKGEIGGLVLEPSKITPWDQAPVVGISRRMGFKFFGINRKTGALILEPPILTKEIGEIDHNQLVIHEAHVAELGNWLNQQKGS